MSGHSKWANIKHRKEKSDAKKGKQFTKIGREIAVAVKEGGPDPETNSKLKDVVAKAKNANMPNENIERSIKKAAGDINSNNFEEIMYEGYGAGGIAVIVEAMTDNRNRTAGDIRHYFDKFGGNLGQSGCVLFMFEKTGVILIENNNEVDEDNLIMHALETGAQDIISEDEYYEVLVSPENYYPVRETLENKGYKFISSGVEMVPSTMIKLKDPEQIKMMEKLIDNLEDMDDVQNVYHNWDRE
jgi:YebC/PmpR family DNA-binding regulatory protein